MVGSQLNKKQKKSPVKTELKISGGE